MPDQTISDPKAQPFGVLALAGIILGILLAMVKAFVWSRGAFSAEVEGYAFAAAMIPGATAYAIAGRRKARNPNRFALSFPLLSTFLAA